MHHGGGAQNVQRQLQRSKSFTSPEAEDQAVPVAQQQAAPVNLPQSPVTSFASAASPSAPQSPNYQIIMSRSPVAGQNMNITLQNVAAAANQQITLTPLPLPNPASPGFQHSASQWRFEPSSSSYIQVTSPLPQSPTQHSPVPRQGSAPAATAGLGVCSQSPRRFVETSMLVQQISLGSPSGSGHFVYQDGSGLAQLAPPAPGQVAMTSSGAPGAVRERRLSQPHSHTGGTIHHLGPQSPVASGTPLSTLGPSHITTSNLPPQISSIIQGQLSRPMIFDKPTQGVVSGVGPAVATAATFGMTSAMPPSSPSRSSNPSQVLPNTPLTPTGCGVKKQPLKKLEEIAPPTPEVAQLRKQCLEHHTKKMEELKEVFKEYLIELFFLQHLQGNMMDYLAFKKKPCVPLFTYLRQNDLDLEEEEEEEQSEVINDEVKVVTGKDGQTGTPVAIATQLPPNVSAAFSTQPQFQAHQAGSAGSIGNTVDLDAFKRHQALAQADQAKRSRIEVGRHGMLFQHHGVAPLGSAGVPLQQLMPTAQGGMPPTPQAMQMGGQKQNQQQYDPSKGPPVQNAASLHTPPPPLPGRLPAGTLPVAGLPLSLSQSQLLEVQSQAQQKPLLAQGNPHAQLQVQQHQPGLPMQVQPQQLQPPQTAVQASQATVALVRPGADASQTGQTGQRLMTNSLSATPISSASVSAATSHSPQHVGGSARPVGLVASASQSKLIGHNPNSGMKMGGQNQTPSTQTTQESSQDKQVEQAKLESQVHQRVAELRKEGQWSASRLPKLLEAPRPKSHWDYLLEEMQWMAADFAQERRWKTAVAKKLVRTCARYHIEVQQGEEQARKKKEMHQRQMAGSIAREVAFFWSNLEQVVEIKLRCGIYEKRRKALCLQRASRKGMKITSGAGEKVEAELSSCARKRKASALVGDEEYDEESTIEEQEAMEVAADHQAELADLTREAELPLDMLVKQYGAYAENFEWPVYSQSEDEERDEEIEEPPFGDPETVLIDSLLCVDQYRGSEKAASPGADGKPQRDIAEVAAATELLLPKGNARTSAAVRGSPPLLLHGSLREYQQIGLDWLASLHRKRLNGILADETGLGKTVQTVAFFAHLACHEGIWGPHLVVVRTCKLLSWEMEFKRWCPGLKILLYLGNKRERGMKRTWWAERNGFHVCITSYKLLLKDQVHFLKKRWHYLVLDEVQLIKNMTEHHWETIFSLKSQQRLLLISTPLQNTLKELWTMIHFLLPGINRPFLDFPVKPGTDQNQDYCHKLVIRLHRMIQPFILRRSKRDVEKQLPKKYEHILKCRLSGRQKSLYEDVMTQLGAQEALKTGHFVNVLRVLLELQQICNHPDLVSPREQRSAYASQALKYSTPSLVLSALAQDPWKTVDLSIFDLISNEAKLSHYETAEAVPRLKVTRQLIEEIHSAPDPPPRAKSCKIKPMSLFQPVQYGTKPEGRTVPLNGNQAQRTPAPTPATAPVTTTATAPAATAAQPAQARGKSPITPAANTAAVPATTPVVTPASPSAPLAVGAVAPSLLPQRLVLASQAQARLLSGDMVKIAQLASITGNQSRVSQPETPVTLQFQGNKFTLSPSQLRQLTAGQPLQLQGNILQIVSAPGQQILRPPGSLVMQTMPPALPMSNTTTATMPGGVPAPPTPATAQVPGVPGKATAVFGEQVALAKPHPAAPAVQQESSEERSRHTRERLSLFFAMNERRCSRAVIYGKDFLKACSVSDADSSSPGHSHNRWTWVGRESCLKAQRTCVSTVSHLRLALLSNEQLQEAGTQLSKRFCCVIPSAVAPPPHLYASSPPSQYSMKRVAALEAAAPHATEIHRLTASTLHQFPDRQLLQMDSGKLEALAVLLHKLHSEKRRVLIFTQMVKMLDILEAFLDYRKLTYMRVDERLPLEERQEQMRSFNRNRQVFCAILTNRCGSAVGQIFDADTIVFYDTDLNPSMDSRAQEWCDRIGRSKDIHIYRLESGNSIEEKLLKNGTKDLIREVAAQGTDYTLAFLTQRTIQDLFEVESGTGEKVEEFVVLHQDPSPSETISPRIARPYIQALNSISQERPPETAGEGEDEEEVLEEKEEPAQLEELEAIMEQLTPIEKYALQYLEYLHVSESEEKATQEKVDSAKRGWEIKQQHKLQVEEKERAALEQEEDLFTYTREDAYNMEYVFEGEDGQTEIMPVWTPPTPPQDDNDIYIDSVICLMYDTAPMPESKLPPVYVRKEHKRLKMDPSAIGRKKKKGHGEMVNPPRSLFDKPSLLKVRREGKDQKKNFSLKQQAPFAKPLPSLVKPPMEVGQDSPEWLISEDWALLQAVKHLLELPLNLNIVSPAHTPNWDLVSDVVNSCSRIYRSPKQCRSRYENVIIPREEGKLVYETNPKKKTKTLYKTKNSRPLRTCQIYMQDDNASQVQLYSSRFELMKIIASKRSPPIKPLLGMNPFQKNPKHASVLAESGISYDKPLPPIQVASQRAERIAKEKKAQAEQHRAQQLAQQQQQQPPPGTPQTPSNVSQQQPQAPAVAQAAPQGVPQPQPVAGAPAVPNTAVLTGAIKTAATGTSIQTATVGGNVIVNTVASVPNSPFQANKRLAAPIIQGAMATAGAAGAQVVHAQQRAVPAATAPAEVVTIATNQGVRPVTPVTAPTVVSTSLPQIQTQPRSLVTQVTPAQGMQLAQGKPITQAHLQMLQRQQLQQQATPSQIKAVGKPQQQDMLKLQKQKMQLAGLQQPPQQQQQVVAAVAAAAAQQGQQAGQQPAQPAQPGPQLAAVAAPRQGTMLTGTTVANLHVARLARVPGQIQTQAAQTAQVALTKPSVVSVPTVVSSAVTVAGISVAIGQAQKAGTQVGPHTFPQMQVQQLLQMKKPNQQQTASATAAQQKAVQQQGQPAVQQKVGVQASQPAHQQQQKVTYATATQLQPGIKPQYITASIQQPQKPAGAQQIQIQAQPQTVTLSQPVSSGPQPVQVLPAAAVSQVAQQKILQQQVVTAATVAAPAQVQTQTPPPQSPAPAAQQALPTPADGTTQQQTQGKSQARSGASVRVKAPAKPSGGS